MAKNLFVGSLPFSTTDDELKELFAQFGEVIRANVVMDRDSGRSRGFGFVEMTEDDAAATAIKQLDGSELQGRRITVSEARPKPTA